MRLLFLTSRLPFPPNRGDRLRAYHFIRNLAKEHEISLISLIADKREIDFAHSLKDYCQVQVLHMNAMQSVISVGLNIWRQQPFQSLYYRSSAMQKLIDQTIAKINFDVVYVHLFRMAPFVAKYPDLYRIVDLTDVVSQEIIRSMPYRGILSKIVYSLELPRIEQYERWVTSHFDETWLISESDRAVLAASCPQANIQVIRNGVDTERLRPISVPEEPNSLIFVGHLGVFHNVDAANYLVKEILPRVQSEIADVNVKLVGAAPISEIQALSAIPGVEVTGYVADLNTALNQSAVFVAPLRFAAGVQNKVLEAMAAGRPVITTSLVNLGLGAQPGRDLLIADTPESIAVEILNLLRNQELRKKLGEAARNFVQMNYRWDFVSERMQAIQQLTEKRDDRT